MENRVITGVIGAFVVICLVGAALVPLIDNMGEGEPVVNPDAGWIRMNYDASASTYEITISPTDDGVSVTNGTDTQIGADDTIFYADSNLSVWMQDGTVNVLGQNTDGPQFLQPEDAVTITRTADGVSVSDGVTDLSFDSPSWAYVPVSTGTYGFFADGVAASTGGNPIAAVGGGFAGVYAYNDITRYAGLGLTLQTVMENGQITGAYWDKAAPVDALQSIDPVEPFDPSAITFDPSIIDLDPIDFGSGAQLMAVPTPTYISGDWGYDLEWAYHDGVYDQKAIIVSYSGAGGDIVVPATIGGYDVYRLGKSENSTDNVFDNSTLSANSTLTISEGIRVIGAQACYNCTNIVKVNLPDSVFKLCDGCFGYMGLTGELVIPDTVTDIQSSVYSYNTGLTGTLVLPNANYGTGIFYGCTGLTGIVISDGITSIPGSIFEGCSGLTGELVIPDSVTNIGGSAFKDCSGLTGELVIPDSVTTIGNQAFRNCYGIKGALVIPDSVESIGTDVFKGCQFSKGVFASDMNLTVNVFNTFVLEVLDLSETIDFETDRHGATNATVSESIGDSSGYIGTAIIPGPSGVSDSVMSLMLAIPVVIFGALIAVGAAIFIRRE